jgi:hypothetical protein
MAKTGKLTPEDALQRKVAHHAVTASLGAALVDFASEAGVTVRVDWKGLEETGVTAKTRVAVDLEKVTWRQVLEVMLSRVSRPGHPLSWRCEPGEILISTQQRILLLEAGRKADLVKVAQQAPSRLPAAPPPVMPKTILPGVNFDKLPFRDVLAFFKTVTGANFHVNWRALQQEGVDPETPITLNVRNIGVSRALDLVLDEVNADRDKFTSVYWVVDRGVLMISTGNALNRNVVTRVIEAGGVLLVQPDVPGPRMNLDVSRNASSMGGGSSNANNELWKDDETRNRQTREEEPYSEQKKKQTENVINTIKNMIGQDMWEPDGKGSIRVINNRLVISQTLLGFKMLEQALR